MFAVVVSRHAIRAPLPPSSKQLCLPIDFASVSAKPFRLFAERSGTCATASVRRMGMQGEDQMAATYSHSGLSRGGPFERVDRREELRGSPRSAGFSPARGGGFSPAWRFFAFARCFSRRRPSRNSSAAAARTARRLRTRRARPRAAAPAPSLAAATPMRVVRPSTTPTQRRWAQARKRATTRGTVRLDGGRRERCRNANQATALGSDSTASGDNSTAVGANNTASGNGPR